MRRVFLSLGSNIEPSRNIPACLKRLNDIFRVLKTSAFYETDPVGAAGEEKFWNASAVIETDLPDTKLRRALRAIENDLGRKRTPQNKFAPRTIDIDIVPFPGFQELSFVMIPLSEIAPEEKDTDSGKTYRELADRFMQRGIGFRKMAVT